MEMNHTVQESSQCSLYAEDGHDTMLIMQVNQFSSLDEKNVSEGIISVKQLTFYTQFNP